MVPVDHVFATPRPLLPAVAAIRPPGGGTHFVVLWRRLGPWVQVMDPAMGRRWMTQRAVARNLFIHTIPVPAAEWREWAGTGEFTESLRFRLDELGIPDAQQRLTEVLSDPDWRPVALLDAATRAVNAVVRTGVVKKGLAASRVLDHLSRPAADALKHVPSS